MRPLRGPKGRLAPRLRRKTFDVLAARPGRKRAAVAQEAGPNLIAGTSFKGTLDCNLDDSTQRKAALRQILYIFEQVAAYMAVQATDDPARTRVLAVAKQVRTHDGVATTRQG